MKYVVHGIRETIVSIEVDADSETEAMMKADEALDRSVDVWDSNTLWQYAVWS